MKRLIALLSLIACLPIFGATWTIHGAKDNYLYFNCSIGSTWQWAYWDLGWDLAYPEQADSGFYFWDGGESYPTSYISGLQERWTFDGAGDGLFQGAYLSGPGPDYNGLICFWPDDLLCPLQNTGEYWVDFASDGTARISTTQPADFGKWAWDGSINPSWVEPLVVKGKKGHRK